MEPSTKKIKLSLEPCVDNNVVDITNAGQEILKTPVSLPEKLMQSVDRIWFERGEWKDISEKSLLKTIEKRKQQPEKEQEEKEVKAKEEEDDDDDDEQGENATPALPPGFDIHKLRESVINKLFHAKSEIDVALDVINILAASNRGSSAAVKDLVLPAGSLTATYVTKPKPTTKAQLESIQLNLGLKRKQQKQASSFLRKSADALKQLVEKEQVFWDEALDLRRNNWQLHANTAPGNINAGSSFFVQYGYAEVGSDFNEASVGELKRSDDASNKLQLSLPHGTPRKVSVRISQSHMGRLGLGRHQSSDGVLGLLDDEEEKDHLPATMMLGTTHSEIQNQLAEANSTVFDAELFSDILAEAQALNSNVRFPDDEIVINIDGQIDLHILKTPSRHAMEAPKMTTQEMAGRSIDLAFRLLLLQHQRFHLWKTKAKLLSSNHKIHQLLPQNDTAVATPATNAPTPVAGTTPSTPISTAVPSTIGSNGSVASSRARTKLTRDLPKQIPILVPIMSLTRFWVQFDRVRGVTHKILNDYRGLALSVHFKFIDSISTPTRLYDAYPGYGQLAVCLGLSVLHGPSLHFSLSQSGAISVCLPQTTVVLQNVSEFEAFLSREIKVICLRMVCDVANTILGQSSWQVDQVDEAIHGAIQSRNITVRLTSNRLEFCLGAGQDLPELNYAMELNRTTWAMNFKERVCVLIQRISHDATMTTAPSIPNSL